MNTPASSRARWADVPSPEERANQLAQEERLVRRDIRRAFAVTIGACFLSLATGLALMALAFHTTDRELGQIAFLGGLLVGYSGMVVSLARYYLHGERSGWW